MRQFTAAMLLLTSTGCSLSRMIDKATLKSVMPGMMPASDIGQICTAGTALGPLTASLDPDDPPQKALVLTGMAAGMCADLAVWEAELERRRAPHEGRGAAAEDLLARESRLHADAARRYFSAWENLEAAFGPVGEGCPDLNEKRNEDTLYLLGLSSGVLAMLHDRAAQGEVGVPMDIPPRVARAATCLDDEKFWAVPSALEGALTASIPGPDQAAGLEQLDAAAARGAQTGVRLAQAFQVQTLSTTGRTDALRAAIEAHAASMQAVPGDPSWRLLDGFASRLILHESDRIWMSEEGKRTPIGALGTFPGTDAFDFGDDLLRDLIPAAPEETTPEEQP